MSYGIMISHIEVQIRDRLTQRQSAFFLNGTLTVYPSDF